MSDDAGRPQDQGRRHRKRGAPSPETVTLLDRYQAAMRDELSTLLGDLAGKPSAPGLLDVATDTPAIERPALKDRAAMWDLAIKLGRELGTSIDTRPPNAAAVEAAEAPARRRGRVDYGP